jgi:dihydroorotate dehydrogenase electron transfer subunit
LFQGLAKVLSQREVMPGIYLMQIHCAGIADVSRPGQFVMISCGMDSGRLLRRPISINRVLKDHLDLLFAVVGEGTNWLATRKPGETVDVLGPLGNGFTIQPDARNILLVAGGMGLAPLFYLNETAIQGGLSTTLLIGAKSSPLVLPRNLLPQNVKCLVTTEDGSEGKKGMITSLILEHARTVDQIFICGPLPMYRAIESDFPAWFKEKPVQVSLEARMGCGLGFCYSCTIKTHQGLKQVCKDGPVFNLADVIWDELI